jgi:hypothetical protein
MFRLIAVAGGDDGWRMAAGQSARQAFPSTRFHASKQQRPHQDESGSRQRSSLFSDSFDDFTLLHTIDMLIQHYLRFCRTLSMLPAGYRHSACK